MLGSDTAANEGHMRKKKLEFYQAALKLAGSGSMSGWKNIQDELLKKGFRKAPDLLDSDKIRTILDLRCAESRAVR